MANRIKTGLSPAEMSFLCEMELVTIIPRQRLEALQLLGGPTEALNPPRRANVPLWLALLLKKQHRANIVPPPWLNPYSLAQILDTEKTSPSFSPAPPLPASNNTSSLPQSPPFIPTSISTTANADQTRSESLPYHWLEMSHLLLSEASDDIGNADAIATLIRDIREVRRAKIRQGIGVLEGGREVGLTGVGGLEVCEVRGFVSGVIDRLRGLGMSKEVERREREEEGEDADDMSE